MRQWTPYELKIAADMRALGASFTTIGKKINRSTTSVRDRFIPPTPEQAQRKLECSRRYKRKRRATEPKYGYPDQTIFPHMAVPKEPPDPVAVAEWRRAQAADHESLTAALMGDPLPMRSALHKRRADVHQSAG